MPPIIPKLRKPQPWLRKFTRPNMATYEHVVCAPPISEPSESLPDLELAYLNLVSLYEQQLADANKTRKCRAQPLDEYPPRHLRARPISKEGKQITDLDFFLKEYYAKKVLEAPQKSYPFDATCQ